MEKSQDLPCPSRRAGTRSLALVGTSGSSAQTAAGETPAEPACVSREQTIVLNISKITNNLMDNLHIQHE